jgi:hypothetical protein
MKVLIAVLTLLATIAVAGDKAEPKELTAAREAYLMALAALDTASKDALEKAAIAKEIAAVHKLAGVDDSEAERVAALMPGTWKAVQDDDGKKIVYIVAFKKDGTWLFRLEDAVESGRGTWKIEGSKFVFRDSSDRIGTADLKKVGRAFTLEYPEKMRIRGKVVNTSLRFTKQKDD